jgi:short-subunit dehydrogenase
MTTPGGIGRNEDLATLLADRDYSDVKFNFANKNFIMTGASSGIGRVVARKLLRNGANVAVLGRNINALNSLLEDPKRNGECIVCKLDLAKPTEIEETFYKLI